MKKILTTHSCSSFGRFAVGCLAIAALVVSSAAAQSQSDSPSTPKSGTPQVAGKQLSRLSGHVLPFLPQAKKLPRSTVHADEPISITVTLNWSDQSAFEAYAKSVSDPQSANYRQALSLADINKRFGPSQDSYNLVLNYLVGYGFRLADPMTGRFRLLIIVEGTRAEAERAFNLSIDNYQLEGRTFFANEAEPSLPLAIRPLVRGIAGLSNFAVLRHDGVPNTLSSASIATAYGSQGLPPGITGAGQTVAFVELGNCTVADVNSFIAASGAPANINRVSFWYAPGGILGAGLSPTTGSSTEACGDIDTVLGIAPGANIVVYVGDQNSGHGGKTVYDMSYYALTGTLSSDSEATSATVSSSWYSCEYEKSDSDRDAMEDLLETYTAAGVSFFESAGDNGATCINNKTNYSSPQFPADAPDAVAVGGTTLNVGSGNSYQSESWWNNSLGAGGFGISDYFSRPGFQNGYTNAVGRSLPDVSADADPNTGFNSCVDGNCTTNGFGGTSMAAPIWAAVWALVCQASGTPCGSANAGRLYHLQGAGIFHSSSSMTAPNNDFAHLGLGSPNITNLAAAVAGPPVVSAILGQNSGPVTGGTQVTLTGRNFIGVTGVSLMSQSSVGQAPVASISEQSTTQMTFTTPPWVGADVADIIVNTPAGSSIGNPAVSFTYDPVVSSMSPNSGPMTGNTAVTFTGQGFVVFPAGATQAYFGAASAQITCGSTTQCIAYSPAENAGTVNVTIHAGGGSTSAGSFTYAGPTISSITPSSGPQSGHSSVYVSGDAFAPNTSFYFNTTPNSPTNNPATYVNCYATTFCEVYSPSGTGAVDVVAGINGIFSARSSSDRYTYLPYPTVFGILPTSGPATGGTLVTINGTNFSTAAGQTTISFGANVVTAACLSTTTCTVNTPAGSQIVQVRVTANSLPSVNNQIFTYVPVVSNITPASGTQVGGTNVQIQGAGFAPNQGGFSESSVSFGLNPASVVACSDSSHCTATSPTGTGTVNVYAVVDGQTSAPSPSSQFTYTSSGVGSGWTKWYPASAPSPIFGVSIAYDSARGVMLYFGANGINTIPGETWTWNGGSWTQLSPATSPIARSGGSFATDAATGTVVLFGGMYEAFVAPSNPPHLYLPGGGSGPVPPAKYTYTLQNDTWSWDGNNWTQLHPVNNPPKRFQANMAYDAKHSLLVLFGGCADPGCSVMLNDTWTWDGTNWSKQIPANSPPARSGASFAYDGATGNLILFGGVGSGSLLADTWLWDGTTWTQQQPSANPAAREAAGLAYYPASNSLVLFGGITSSSLVGDMWTWNGSAWSLVPPTTPGPTSQGLGMGYDLSIGTIVLLDKSGSTWTWKQ